MTTKTTQTTDERDRQRTDEPAGLTPGEQGIAAARADAKAAEKYTDQRETHVRDADETTAFIRCPNCGETHTDAFVPIDSAIKNEVQCDACGMVFRVGIDG